MRNPYTYLFLLVFLVTSVSPYHQLGSTEPWRNMNVWQDWLAPLAQCGGCHGARTMERNPVLANEQPTMKRRGLLASKLSVHVNPSGTEDFLNSPTSTQLGQSTQHTSLLLSAPPMSPRVLRSMSPVQSLFCHRQDKAAPLTRTCVYTSATNVHEDTSPQSSR
jgi:hypothetical protein